MTPMINPTRAFISQSVAVKSVNIAKLLLAFIASVCVVAHAVDAAAAEVFPFVLPWDDAVASPTNVSGWLEKPAGAQGFVRVKDGHLFAGEKRLRIFGVNLAFGADF